VLQFSYFSEKNIEKIGILAYTGSVSGAVGCRCETIELGSSELGGFLGGSLPPPFPPLRIVVFFESDY
jgi:hypothetical protein